MKKHIIHITAEQAAEMHRASQPVKLTKKHHLRKWQIALFMCVLLFLFVDK